MLELDIEEIINEEYYQSYSQLIDFSDSDISYIQSIFRDGSRIYIRDVRVGNNKYIRELSIIYSDNVNKYIAVSKSKDDYFYLSFKKTYYKCDQLHGLARFFKSNFKYLTNE